MVERPLIREEGGEFWSLADEWFDIDPEPTDSSIPLPTESTGGQQPVEGWPSSVEKQKGLHTGKVTNLQDPAGGQPDETKGSSSPVQ